MDAAIWFTVIGMIIGCVWLLSLIARPKPPKRPEPPPTADPVLYMRRWGLLRKRWEADEKNQWDEAFRWYDRRK
jgi:hypothetical protein